MYRRTTVRGPALLAAVFAVLSAACWGFGTVMSRALLDQFAPLTLLVIQLSASVGALALALAVRRGHERLTRDDLWAGLPGLCEPGLAYLFGTVGLAWTSASRASVLSATEPIFVLGLAWLVLRERVQRTVVFFVVIAVIGVWLLTVPGEGAGGDGSIRGDLLVLLGVAAAALYVVLTRRLLHHRAPLPLTFAQQFVGLLMVALVWCVAILLQLPVAALPPLDPAYVATAALSGVVQYALAFWLYLIALKRLPATVAACFLTLTPLFGVGGAALVLHERLTLPQAVGVVCILGPILGLILTQRDHDPNHQSLDA